MASYKDTCVTDDELKLATIIWDYMKLNHVCRKSDLILCLGSYDIRVAEKAASLFLQGMGDLLVFSGNTGKLTENVWKEPEAIVFSERAKQMGVPDENILIEAESTNSGENVRFTYNMLSGKGINPKSFILVQKPYMERRAYATFMKQWPGDVPEAVFVTSPDVELLDYPSDTTGPLSDVINVLVGDLARMKLYEEKGFQIHQDIPEIVQNAFDRLLNSGKYNSHIPTW
ncbi:uncharacterized protein SCO4629-like [Mercenaria mercenaria]|uniref:uncharacterized protein SCO4629-like n=1 Tax=Mercenaria mercenaria TaxID=6596 RepID=UPI00234E63AE|nr:uncharacterized protein SCO4629-like [Mercenaria mercenaria]